MTLLSSKLFIFLFITFILLAILFMIGKKSVSTQVQINTSPEKVWSVLSNAETVKQWNKVLIPLKGQLKEGSVINYEFYQDEGGKASKIDAKVEKIIEQKMINQKGGVPLILTFDHKYILESSPSGTTVKIHEEYKGIIVPFWNPSPVEKAYERLLNQLKDYIENE